MMICKDDTLIKHNYHVNYSGMYPFCSWCMYDYRYLAAQESPPTTGTSDCLSFSSVSCSNYSLIADLWLAYSVATLNVSGSEPQLSLGPV